MRVVWNVNTRLLIAICNYVKLFSWLRKEWRDLSWWNTSSVNWCRWGDLGNITGEDILGTIKIHAELPVVDFSSCTTITVLSNYQIKNFLRAWHQSKTLKYSKELMGSNMKWLRSIKIHKTRFEEDSLCLYLIVHLCNSLHHLIFFRISKDLNM